MFENAYFGPVTGSGKFWANPFSFRSLFLQVCFRELENEEFNINST